MVDVAIVGAAGYTGVELARWVLGHPQMRLATATSAADAGRPLSDLYPALSGLTDVVFEAPDAAAIAARVGMAFLAVPHTAAIAIAPALVEAGVTVVDLSADFRISDATVYEAWYDTQHTAPDLLAEAVYGLPELDRSALAGARLVACPGCYPTATTLAALPALAAGMGDGSRIIVDAKSGVSGAGRSATPGTHFCTVNESLAPYKVAAHRHIPEIEQSLSRAAGDAVSVVFSPHLVPMTRGLLSTVYVQLARPMTAAAAHALYAEHFALEPFVRVCQPGQWPSTAEVRGTNRAVVGVTVDERTDTLIAACAIDNLGKGAAGQAVQCANAVLGIAETTGLDAPAPVV